jgi:hypothetical protein
VWSINPSAATSSYGATNAGRGRPRASLPASLLLFCCRSVPRRRASPADSRLPRAQRAAAPPSRPSREASDDVKLRRRGPPAGGRGHLQPHRDLTRHRGALRRYEQSSGESPCAIRIVAACRKPDFSAGSPGAERAHAGGGGRRTCAGAPLCGAFGAWGRGRGVPARADALPSATQLPSAARADAPASRALVAQRVPAIAAVRAPVSLVAGLPVLASRALTATPCLALAPPASPQPLGTPARRPARISRAAPRGCCCGGRPALGGVVHRRFCARGAGYAPRRCEAGLAVALPGPVDRAAGRPHCHARICT